jgi:hypothetical protein
MGLVVNHELSLTEARIKQLDSEVDVFIILESPMTSGKGGGWQLFKDFDCPFFKLSKPRIWLKLISP